MNPTRTTFYFDFRTQHDAVTEDRFRERLHIIRSDEVTSRECGPRTAAKKQALSGARTRANHDTVMGTGGTNNIHDIVRQFLPDSDLRHRRAQAQHFIAREHFLHGPAGEHRFGGFVAQHAKGELEFV